MGEPRCCGTADPADPIWTRAESPHPHQPTGPGAGRLVGMSTPPPADEPEIRTIDRLLTFGALGLAALSVICFFTIIIGTAVGMKQADFTHGAWPVVGVFPFWGLP